MPTMEEAADVQSPLNAALKQGIGAISENQEITFTLYISLLLAFFNMLPVYPLDGSKVIRWNFTTYFAVEAIIFILLILVVPAITSISVGALIIELAFMLVFALVISLLFRGIRL